VAGGWIADRVGRWWAYFGSGTVMALVTVVMAAATRTPTVYNSGVLAYAFFGGAASTKYAALSSLGNVPVVYMTALDGWVHDRFGTGWMLQTDALSAILFVAVALFVLHKINAARAQRSREG
jgi:MFS transporter, PAT family, beta-lactamase induction signal transducer AmpG